MSNTLLNISMITKESLIELKNQLGFSKGVNRQYDSQFAKTGAKIGSVINIRKPVRYSVTDGAALNLQNIADQSVALTVDTQQHVAFQFSSKEMTLSIDEFRDRYIKPAVTALANKIDYTGLQLAKTSVWNSVGTPGTQPADQAAALALALGAGQKLDENGCPVDDMRSMVLNPASQAAMVKGLAGLYNDSAKVAGQYRRGRMAKDTLGFDWVMDQNVASHTTGAMGGTPKIKTTISAQGATSIVWDGGTSGGGTISDVFKAGDVVTFANVYAVNPQSKESTGSLMQFVVQADADGDNSGEGTLTFLPAMYSTGNYQNVSALPADEAAILQFGHASSYASKTSPVNIAHHRDAFALGMADLELPDNVEMADRAVDPDAGLSIRIVKAYDINNDTFPCRLDVLYGWKAIYPELACRVQG